ncbi:MAG: hypothetical protein KDB88_07145 [Flavobacteriales bacterium]|nr:hypothetical protein [Flavobacteriales bacterium]
MRRLLFILFLSIAIPGSAQTKITWTTLQDVRFTEKYSEEEEANFFFPHFGSKVQALEGKEVYLKGYILALDPIDNYYLLSKSPMASCFFCGMGGPETVVELKLVPGSAVFEMDEVATIKGRLKLNDHDIYQCNYILEEAVPYKP